MSVINRVWDTMNGPGFQRWTTDEAQPFGEQYPGPGTYGVDTSDHCVEREVVDAALIPALQHDLTHTPVSLWQFDGDLTDVQGIEDLTVSTGTARYGPGPAPGTRSLYCDGGLYITGVSSPAPAALRILGSMTYEALIRPTIIQGLPFGDMPFSCSGDDTSETTPNNILWNFRLRDDLNYPSADYEGAAAANQFIQADILLPPNQWAHIAYTRDTSGGGGAVVTRLYVNGRTVARVDAGILPTDGANAIIKVGDDNVGNTPYEGYLAGLKVMNIALTPAQVLAEARRTLPPEIRP